MVAPVPYSTWLPLNGSIATLPIHQPNFAVPPNARNGEAEISRVALAPTSTQVAPASVERKMVSMGEQRSLLGVPRCPAAGPKVTKDSPMSSGELASGKLVTWDQVTPPSVLRHSPLAGEAR